MANRGREKDNDMVRFHPGETLREKLQEMEMSVKEFALRIEKPEQMVLDLIDCKMAVNAEWALLLEYALGISAEFWLNKQSNYDLSVLRKSRTQYQDSIESWMRSLPLQEMIDNGWVEGGEDDASLAGAMLKFFGVSNVKSWENYYFGQHLKVAFRITLNGTINPYALSAWLRRGEIQAQGIFLDEPYSKNTLSEKMPEIATMLAHPVDNVLNDVQDFLGDLGIKLIYTEPLSEVPIKGASRWIYGHPCIQLPKVLEMYDSYARTLLHELGHIFLHGKKDVFLENAGLIPDDPESYNRKESEADAFAIKWYAAGVAGSY